MIRFLPQPNGVNRQFVHLAVLEFLNQRRPVNLTNHPRAVSQQHNDVSPGRIIQGDQHFVGVVNSIQNKRPFVFRFQVPNRLQPLSLCRRIAIQRRQRYQLYRIGRERHQRSPTVLRLSSNIGVYVG